MKRLMITLGILLATLGCADNKKGDPATLDDGSSKRMTELDSISKISIIKDTTVWPGLQPGQPKWTEDGARTYNIEWEEYIKNNPDATKDEIMEKANELMREIYGQ